MPQKRPFDGQEPAGVSPHVIGSCCAARLDFRHGNILYACTVFCTVYRLRHFGERLDKEAVKHTAARGYLTLGPKPLGPDHILVASLGTPQMPDSVRLGSALVRKIEADGFMIYGVETYLNHHMARQVWWCVPCEPGDCTPDMYERLTSTPTDEPR